MRRADLAPWIAAVLVHGAVFLALAVVPLRRLPTASTNDAEAAEPAVDVALDALDDEDADEKRLPAAPPAAAEPNPGAPSAFLAPSSGTRRSAPGVKEPSSTAEARAKEPSPLGDVDPNGGPGRDEGAQADGATAVPLGPVELGIGGKNPFLPRSEGAVALAESKRAVGRALRDPARERETELGLGPEGPVLTALGEATSRSAAPVRGRAVFVATADASGTVTSIELADAEGSRAGWDDARRIALAALAGKALRLPTGTTRAVMRIEVTSGWKLPSGQDPGANVSVFRVPVAKGETKDSTTVNILDPIPKIRVVEVPISKDVKLPVVSVQLDLFSTNTDPANWGSKPRRVVHARLVESQRM